MTDHLQTLLDLTLTLGQPHRNYVIIGEGNTSCRVDEDTFLVKASGQGMETIAVDGFVRVRFAPTLALLDQPDTSLEEMHNALQLAKADPNAPGRPSIEATFHAMLLAECGANFIGHTHPTAVNGILCSTRARDFAANRLFPDEAVLCGPESVFVPYADPGLPLALAIRHEVQAYMKHYAEAPKVILLASHGLIALGKTAQEVLNITAMCVKAAQIFTNACAVSEPVFMSQADIMHIYKRPDEIYRRGRFVEK